MSFTPEQFIAVFERFNEAIWPLQIVAYALGVVVVALLFSRARARHRAIPAVLALFWAFTGVVFMWGFETDIMQAAYAFGALFVAGSAALLWAGVIRGRLTFAPARDVRSAAGLTMIGYALVIYPVIGALVGHPYPEAPLFGVAPCPTAIFTLGLLLTVRPFPWRVAVVPLIWAFFGSNAAFRFGIHEDLGLLVAAVATLALVLTPMIARRRSTVAGERREGEARRGHSDAPDGRRRLDGAAGA